MRIGRKISWALADKATFLVYGLIFRILQIRSLPPEEFGLYALFEAAFIFLFVIADHLALAPAIKFGSDLQERPRVNFLSIIVYATCTLGFAMLLFLLRSPLSVLLNEPRFLTVAAFFPPYIALTIPRMYLLSIQQRDLYMHRIFAANLVWMGTMAGVTLILLFSDHLHTFEDMMLIVYSGSIASSAHLLWLSRSQLQFSRKGKLKLREFLSFSGFLAGGGIFSTLLLRLDTYIVQMFFSTATTGIYQSAKTLFRLFESPTHAVGSVFFPAISKVAHAQDYDQLRSLTQRSLTAHFWVSLFGAIVAIATAPYVIGFLLPAKYALAIPFFQVLALAGCVLPLTLQIFILIAIGKTNILFRYIIIAVVIGLSTLLLAGIFQCPTCIPLGTVLYHTTIALLTSRFLHRSLRFPLFFFLNIRNIFQSATTAASGVSRAKP